MLVWGSLCPTICVTYRNQQHDSHTLFMQWLASFVKVKKGARVRTSFSCLPSLLNYFCRLSCVLESTHFECLLGETKVCAIVPMFLILIFSRTVSFECACFRTVIHTFDLWHSPTTGLMDYFFCSLTWLEELSSIPKAPPNLTNTVNVAFFSHKSGGGQKSDGHIWLLVVHHFFLQVS